MRIVTHPGVFHADEILAVALISLAEEKEIAELDIIRTRDVDILESAKADLTTYVLDVGGVCNAALRCYDHHQRDFDLLNKAGTKFSTFGLIVQAFRPYFDSEVWRELEDFAVKVDNHDNGIKPCDELRWISDLNGIGIGTEEAFLAALTAARNWLRGMLVNWEAKVAQDLAVVKAIAEAGDNPIIVSDVYVPVDERLNAVETAQLLVTPRPDGTWNIQTLNVGIEKDFSQRCPAPEIWRGRSGFKVGNVNVVFCHAGGFLTVAESKDDALMLANRIVSYNA